MPLYVQNRMYCISGRVRVCADVLWTELQNNLWFFSSLFLWRTVCRKQSKGAAFAAEMIVHYLFTIYVDVHACMGVHNSWQLSRLFSTQPVSESPIRPLCHWLWWLILPPELESRSRGKYLSTCKCIWKSENMGGNNRARDWGRQADSFHLTWAYYTSTTLSFIHPSFHYFHYFHLCHCFPTIPSLLSARRRPIHTSWTSKGISFDPYAWHLTPQSRWAISAPRLKISRGYDSHFQS